MLDAGHDSSRCEFSENSVAYVYDELGVSEREIFEAHLSACATCPEEVAAFAALSGSVREWKSLEFDSLATPSFVVPYGRETERVDGSPGFWETLKEQIFGGAFALKTVGAFATLLLIAMVAWTVISTGGETELASNNNSAGLAPGTKVIGSDKSAGSKVESLTARAGNEGSDPTSAASKTQTPAETVVSPVAVETRISAPAGTKAFSPSPKPRAKGSASNGSSKKPGSNSKKNNGTPKTLKQTPAPAIERLSDMAQSDEFEDDSLRLTDLFAITESKEE